MSQVFGYICSDDSLTAEVMSQVGQPLRAIAPEERIGLGIGWLQEGRSLLRKHPKRKAASVDIPSLLADVPTRSLVGHVRHRDQGRAGTKQLQPFRFRNWVYAQAGVEGSSQELHETLKTSIPDHVRRNIAGSTLAELLFHTFYTKVESRLSKTSTAEWSRLYARKLGQTAIQLESLEREQGRDEEISLLSVAATDRCLVACRMGQPLSYLLVEGIEEASEAPLFAGHKPRTINHDRFRALMVANKVDAEGWQEIPDRHVLWVDDDWEVNLEAMD